MPRYSKAGGAARVVFGDETSDFIYRGKRRIWQTPL
jgi:hypothetical protein